MDEKGTGFDGHPLEILPVAASARLVPRTSIDPKMGPWNISAAALAHSKDTRAKSPCPWLGRDKQATDFQPK